MTFQKSQKKGQKKSRQDCMASSTLGECPQEWPENGGVGGVSNEVFAGLWALAPECECVQAVSRVSPKCLEHFLDTLGRLRTLSRAAKGGRQGGHRQFEHGSCFCSGLATFAQSLINIGQAGFCTLSWQLNNSAKEPTQDFAQWVGQLLINS